jgi:hypothetical protein
MANEGMMVLWLDFLRSVSSEPEGCAQAASLP